MFRFKVVHREGSLDWLLQIKFLQLRDAGLYECQVLKADLSECRVLKAGHSSLNGRQGYWPVQVPGIESRPL